MARLPKEPDPKLTDYGTMYDELIKLPDSAFAITAAAILDEKLKLVLSAFLVSGNKQAAVVHDLMQPERALGTYGSRTKLSYVLGILSENEYDALTAIGTIRNKFAHGLYGVTFSEPQIERLCSELRLARGDRKLYTRTQFFATFVKLLGLLSSRATQVSSKTYKRTAWPEHDSEEEEVYLERVYGIKKETK